VDNQMVLGRIKDAVTSTALRTRHEVSQVILKKGPSFSKFKARQGKTKGRLNSETKVKTVGKGKKKKKIRVLKKQSIFGGASNLQNFKGL
jgi:hypothetical protein